MIGPIRTKEEMIEYFKVYNAGKDFQDLLDSIKSWDGVSSTNLNSGNIVSWMIMVNKELMRLNSKMNGLIAIVMDDLVCTENLTVDNQLPPIGQHNCSKVHI